MFYLSFVLFVINKALKLQHTPDMKLIFTEKKQETK